MDNVLYTPGNEPENIRKRIDRLFAKLDEAYPDKVISGLNKDHKKWGETVTQLYRLLGYSSGKAFLEAYGYTVVEKKAGRKAGDHFEIIAELKRRYPEGPTCSTLLELKEQNPDMAPKFKNLTNQATALFGMTLAKFFEQEGILKPKSSSDEALEEKVEKVVTPKLSIEEKLIQVTEKLKEKYSEDDPFTGTMTDLSAELGEVSIKAFSNWIKKIHNETVKEYLIRVGIMAKSNTVEQPEAMNSTSDTQIESETEKPVETVCIDGMFFVENGVLKKYSGKQSEIIIPDCVSRIDNDLFFENSTIRKVFISDSVKLLGWNVFYGCKLLKEVRLSESIDFISPGSFTNTALRRITIPSNVRNISRNAFEKCKLLREVIVLPRRINIEPSAFIDSPNVIIYCHDELINDIHRVTGLPCKSLSLAHVDDDSSKAYYYDDTALMRDFSADADPVEKAKTYKVTLGSKEFKVRIKAETCIDEFEDYYPFYSISEAEKNYISLEESREEIIAADQNMGTDAYIYDAKPRIDEKSAKKMERDDYLFRFEFLRKVYRSLNNNKTVYQIAEAMPKKKNGTFNLKSYLRIACAGLVDFDCSAIEIVAKAKNDTSLEILVKEVAFSPEEIERIREDFFTNHILIEESTEEKMPDEEQPEMASNKELNLKEVSISLQGVSIPISVITTGKGDYVVEADVSRTLKSFDYLEGSDIDGYEIQLPEFCATVDSAGIQVEVFLDEETFIDAWNEIKAVSQYCHNPNKNKAAFQAVMDVVDYRGLEWTQEKLNRLTETNKSISRYVYALLRSIEHIKKHYNVYAQESADTAPRKKNGDLWSGRPTRFSGFLMEEMELYNYGFSSFVHSVAEKDNKVRMMYEGTIEV